MTVDNLLVLRDAIASFEIRVSALPTHTPTEVSWEEVSEELLRK